jgi:hypothetical protein
MHPILQALQQINTLLPLIAAVEEEQTDPFGLSKLPRPVESTTTTVDAQRHCPSWVTKYFRSKQFTLLEVLFGREAVKECELFEALGYDNPMTQSSNLKRRVSETNTNLFEHAPKIGETWTIRERTRARIKSYFLDRQ